MVQKEGKFVKCYYKRYTGRVAIGVGHSQGMEEVFPIVLEDGLGNVLGIVAMASMEHGN